MVFFFFSFPAAYSCSMQLYLYPGSEKASRYLEYFMHRISLLRHYKVIPVVVFDGGDIPCKSATSNERQRQVMLVFLLDALFWNLDGSLFCYGFVTGVRICCRVTN